MNLHLKMINRYCQYFYEKALKSKQRFPPTSHFHSNVFIFMTDIHTNHNWVIETSIFSDAILRHQFYLFKTMKTSRSSEELAVAYFFFRQRSKPNFSGRNPTYRSKPNLAGETHFTGRNPCWKWKGDFLSAETQRR